MNVAIFGGSFNPPHVAHVMACELVVARRDVDRLLVVPTFRHPFAKELAPYDDRVRMCELATAGIDGVEVSRVEEELGGESRTLRTLEHLADEHPGWRLRLVVGADILGEAHKWFGFEAIRAIAPLIVLGRAGVDAPDAAPAVLPRVSSTAVRAAVKGGDWRAVGDAVPAAVVAYIRERGLYGARP